MHGEIMISKKQPEAVLLALSITFSSILRTDLRGRPGFFFILIFETISYHFFFSFTMVIKQFQVLRGESAFGDRSASSMSKCSAARTLTSEMVPFVRARRDHDLEETA